MSLPVSGPTSRMRSKSTGSGSEDAVRGLRSRRCTHGTICRGYDERPLSSRDDVPVERVRVVSSNRTGRTNGQLQNSSDDRSVHILPRSTTTFTRRISPSSRMCACIVTRTDVGNATRCGQLRQHESTCTGDVRRVFPGGVYHPTPSIFERLDDENIRVVESLRYYPYRATFDFECWFDTEQLPSDSDQVHWVARHVPLSVSVASNVPGHERVKCLVTNGHTNKLVIDMMAILISMSDAAYDSVKDSYENVLEKFAEAMTQWDEQ